MIRYDVAGCRHTVYRGTRIGQRVDGNPAPGLTGDAGDDCGFVRHFDIS